MKCNKCGYDDNGTGDTAHICGSVNGPAFFSLDNVDNLILEARKDSLYNNSNFERKLVELVVRECAKFLEEGSGYDDCNNAWHPSPKDLLNHFGFEE